MPGNIRPLSNCSNIGPISVNKGGPKIEVPVETLCRTFCLDSGNYCNPSDFFNDWGAPSPVSGFRWASQAKI